MLLRRPCLRHRNVHRAHIHASGLRLGGKETRVTTRTLSGTSLRFERFRVFERFRISSVSASGVFVVRNPARIVVYVGMSRDVAKTFADAKARGADTENLQLDVVHETTDADDMRSMWKATLAASVRESGALPVGNQPEHEQNAIWEKRNIPRAEAEPSPHIARAVKELVTKGYAIVDGVLDDNLAAAARQDAARLFDAGKVKSIESQRNRGRKDAIAMVSSGSDGRARPGTPLAGVAFSTKQLVWEESGGGNDCPGLAAAASLLTSIPTALHAAAEEAGGVTCLTTHRVKAPAVLQLARYTDGEYYACHLDNDPRDATAADGPPGMRSIDRAVTAILYLNENPWDAASSGGELRMFFDEGRRTVDVSPAGGRLVLFDSRTVPHEVCASTRERWAISAWLADADE
ncbi:Fe2OG dioxygenase domain-containing protein [Pycnococcus provasolii]